MGAISHNARSTVRLKRTLPSQPLGRVFCCPKHGSFELPGASRNGRPGSRGSRGNARVQARGACRREQGDEPDTDGRVNSKEFANGGASTAPRRNFQNGLPHCAAQPTLVVKMSDTSHGGAPVLLDVGTIPKTPISLVPWRTYQWPALLRRPGGGEDVCYFVVRRFGAERVRGPHAERRFARRGSNSIACSPPTPSTPVVKIAVTSSVKREVAGSNPARRHVRR